jgi:hypothetical protein
LLGWSEGLRHVWFCASVGMKWKCIGLWVFEEQGGHAF